MHALSVHQPYGSAIIAGVKPVENRGIRPPHHLLGRFIVIHATKSRLFLDDPVVMAEIRHLWPAMPVDPPSGALLGVVRLVGVVKARERELCPWSCGPWCLTLADARPFDPISYRGQQGFFHVDDALLPAWARELNHVGADATRG